MIRVLIVDDEAPARALLREMLSAEPDVEILGEAATGLEAVKAAAELQPEAVFLDIEMPKLDGFEVLELLDPRIAVVFVTAYDSHALRAFEVHAVDYVLKPYRAERLREALSRARARVGQRPDPAVLARAARPSGQYAHRVVVKDGAQIHVIPVDRLDYAQAQDDYVALRTDGKTLLKTQTLG
ncbi:MAG TPA: response regulator, partial [Vicinamibacteria bacterium]|nr:response regulator [Vicinamibacteria bacterium]